MLALECLYSYRSEVLEAICLLTRRRCCTSYLDQAQQAEIRRQVELALARDGKKKEVEGKEEKEEKKEEEKDEHGVSLVLSIRLRVYVFYLYSSTSNILLIRIRYVHIHSARRARWRAGSPLRGSLNTRRTWQGYVYRPS